jgi:uncharacterized membrane protein HdeD (DUF308 family)
LASLPFSGPGATVVLLIRLVAVYALVDGALGLVAACRARDLRSNLAPGLISIAVGLILLLWPGLSGRLLLIIVDCSTVHGHA